MSEKIQIRLMRESDLPAMEWGGEFACYRRVFREILRAQERGISKAFLAFTESGEVVGQVFLTRKFPNPDYSPNDPYLFLTSFRVKPAFQGRGLGGRLLRRCVVSAWEEKIPALLLNCSLSNKSAYRFYLHHGFQLVREMVCRWSFVDQYGEVHNECEAAYLLRKDVFWNL